MSLKANGLVYSIKLVTNGLYSKLMGETNFDQCEISISGELCEAKAKQTFWHEVMHIIFEGEETGEEAKDERTIIRTGNLLFQILEDNQILVKDWWTRVVDLYPDYPQLVEGSRVAARGRKR